MRVWLSPRRPAGTLFSNTLGTARGHLEAKSESNFSLANTGCAGISTPAASGAVSPPQRSTKQAAATSAAAAAAHEEVDGRRGRRRRGQGIFRKNFPLRHPPMVLLLSCPRLFADDDGSIDVVCVAGKRRNLKRKVGKEKVFEDQAL